MRHAKYYDWVPLEMMVARERCVNHAMIQYNAIGPQNRTHMVRPIAFILIRGESDENTWSQEKNMSSLQQPNTV